MRKSGGTEGVQSRGGVVVVVVVGMVVVVTAVEVVDDSAAPDSEEFAAPCAPSVRVEAEVTSAVGVIEAIEGLSSEIAVFEQESSTIRPTATGRNGLR